MAAKRFANKHEAEKAAKLFPLAGAVWIGGAIARVEDLVPGWYVGFPQNISRRYLQTNDLLHPEIAP